MIQINDIKTFHTNIAENDYTLQISPLNENVKAEDFIPEDPKFVDAERYHIINKNTGDLILFIGESIDFEQKLIRKLKKINKIEDPWDKDPDYLELILKKYKTDFLKKVEQNLKNADGNFHILSINPLLKEINKKEYIPDLPNYPDGCRYFIHRNDKNGNIIYFNDISFKDAIVKRLKKIQGVHDPWDNNRDLIESWKKNQTEEIINKAREAGQKLLKVKGTDNPLSQIELGEQQVGYRCTKIFLYKKDAREMKELWILYNGFKDRKIVCWTELVIAQNEKKIYQDKEVILERYTGEDDTKWRLISQRWFREYIIDNKGNKKWIKADHNGIENHYEYKYDDDIKVKFKKKN